MSNISFAEFVEYALDTKLLEYQKVYLNSLHQKYRQGEQIVFLPARGSCKFDHLLLLIPILFSNYEKGELNEN